MLQQSRADAAPNVAKNLYAWALNHLAKALIRQAEQEVAAKQDTAYPLARLVLGLLVLEHSMLADVLMARLVKKCPWVLGYVPARGKDEETRAFRKRLGFRVDEDESAHMYTTRMGGICALYFACLQTSLASVAQALPRVGAVEPAVLAARVPRCMRPERMWVWQARCTTPPITQQALLPSLWCVFLEIAGTASRARYASQARKLWDMLLAEGVQRARLGPAEQDADSDTVRSALVRLRLLLETQQQTGSFAEHATSGREMEA